MNTLQEQRDELEDHVHEAMKLLDRCKWYQLRSIAYCRKAIRTLQKEIKTIDEFKLQLRKVRI